MVARLEHAAERGHIPYVTDGAVHDESIALHGVGSGIGVPCETHDFLRLDWRDEQEGYQNGSHGLGFIASSTLLKSIEPFGSISTLAISQSAT